jgi:hypothetical protein
MYNRKLFDTADPFVFNVNDKHIKKENAAQYSPPQKRT